MAYGRSRLQFGDGGMSSTADSKRLLRLLRTSFVPGIEIVGGARWLLTRQRESACPQVEMGASGCRSPLTVTLSRRDDCGMWRPRARRLSDLSSSLHHLNASHEVLGNYRLVRLRPSSQKIQIVFEATDVGLRGQHRKPSLILAFAAPASNYHCNRSAALSQD